MLSPFLSLTLLVARAAFAEAPSTSLKELEGTWIEQVPELPRAGFHVKRGPETLVVRGNLFVTKVGDRELRQSLARAVLADGVQGLDFMTVVGDEFWQSRAIYKLENDQLTICEAVKDEARPTEFRSGFGLLPGEKFTSRRTFKRVRPTSSQSVTTPSTSIPSLPAAP